MKKLLSLYIALVSVCVAAVIQPTASTRTVNTNGYVRHASGAGVGITDGIKRFRPGGANAFAVVNMNLAGYSSTDDISGVINSYLATYKNTGTRIVIPAGTWTIEGTWGYSAYAAGTNGGNVILSGMGQGVTILRRRHTTYTVFDFAYDVAWGNISGGPGAGGVVVSEYLAQGATSLQMSLIDQANNGVSAGNLMKIYWANLEDDAIIATGVDPVIDKNNTANGGNDWRYSEQFLCTGTVGTTVSIWPPITKNNHSSLAKRAYCAGGTYNNSVVGIEDMSIVIDASTEPLPDPLVVVGRFGNYQQAWLFNVEITTESSKGNYLLNFDNVLRSEVRGCYLHGAGAGAGTNHAVFLFSGSRGCLVEDNIIMTGSPTIEVNSSVGNVFAWNFGTDTYNLSHNVGNYANLYVGNILRDFFIIDGYFGSSHADSFVGNWVQKYGIVAREFSFNVNAHGNVQGTTTGTNTYPFVIGWGIPNIGGTDPWLDTKAHSSMLTGNFPIEWPRPAQLFRLTNRISSTLGEFTVQGAPDTFEFVTDGRQYFRFYIQGADAAGALNNTTVINSKTIQGTFEYPQTLPAVGTDFTYIAPGSDGYQQHNDDVYNSLDFRGNFNLYPDASGFPTQNIGSDTIWNPLGFTSAPAGDGLDEPRWGTCPWYTNGGVQYGFINRSSPSSLTDSDNPAGKAYVTSNFTRYNTGGTGTGTAIVSGQTKVTGSLTTP